MIITDKLTPTPQWAPVPSASSDEVWIQGIIPKDRQTGSHAGWKYSYLQTPEELGHSLSHVS